MVFAGLGSCIPKNILGFFVAFDVRIGINTYTEPFGVLNHFVCSRVFDKFEHLRCFDRNNPCQACPGALLNWLFWE